MKKFFILLGLIVLLSASVLAADVNKVGDWWGTVTINGNTGNNGAVVSAYIDSIKVASTIVGQYVSGYYLIHVEGETGDEILFKVNGVDATTFYWSGGDHRLDLNVSISSSSDDSSGGGSSGGGGGGSSGGGSSGGGSSAGSSSSTTGSTSNQEENKENETISINETEESSSTSFLTGAVTGLGEFTKSGAGKTAIGILVIIGGAIVFFKFKKKFVTEVENPEEEKEESSEEKEEEPSEEPKEETDEENQNA